MEWQQNIQEIAIWDNGIGISLDAPPSKGMRMQIMNHRADVIGAMLSICRAGKNGGTVVTCMLPVCSSPR